MSSGNSPKARLSKFFRRSGDKTDLEISESPPSSPVSPNAAQHKGHLRNVSSKASLRDTVSGKRRSRLVTSDGQSNEPTYGAQVAAAKAMGVDDRLPQVPRQSDLSDDFRNLNFESATNEGHYGERVADRNISGSKGTYGNDQLSSSPPLHSRRARDNLRDVSLDQERSVGSKPVLPQLNPYSGSVDDWKLNERTPSTENAHTQGGGQNGTVDGGRRSSMGTPVGRVKSAQESLKATTRKPVNGSLDNRASGEYTPTSPTSPVSRESMDSQKRGVRRSSLHKPLPSIPAEKSLESERTLGEVHSDIGKERGYLVKDAPAPVPLDGIVDLSNTEDTTLHERWAPAVTHETVHRQFEEVRQESITREIHQDHIFHRVLPIVDIEVKPSRHFIPVEGGYAEIAAEELPGRTGDKAQWMIAELASKHLPASQPTSGRRQFTARKFDGGEGDLKEYTAPEGHPVTEQHWVHPPREEDGGRLTGQTYPFYFDEDDPKLNGLRATLPEGKVVGTSELLARQMRATIGGIGNTEAAPPVPMHREMPLRNGKNSLRDDTMSPRFI
nr:hypothetical protein B0A51_17479 [Rachicladosporium sp. CCFEE 5018]